MTKTPHPRLAVLTEALRAKKVDLRQHESVAAEHEYEMRRYNEKAADDTRQIAEIEHELHHIRLLEVEDASL